MSAIELAQPRVIPIVEGKRTYRLTVGVITKEQWIAYFDGILSSSENQGSKQIDNYDSRSARVELVEKVLEDADGYATPDGGPISAVPNWQGLIPMSHRLAAADVLISVGRDPDDSPLMLGTETVILRARWGANDAGVLQEYSGLTHRFKTPSAEHQRRYQRAISRSMVDGGTRTAKTVWLGAQRVLAELYDELIVSVDGYTLNGAPLNTIMAIAASMDTYHKVAAAEQLFAPAMPKLEEK